MSERIPNTYDERIKVATDNFLPEWDWRLVKAQLWQESRMDSEAVSPAGAIGLAQFMPATWEDMIARHGDLKGKNPTDPYAAITACTLYMQQLIKEWKAPRPDMDRYALALASYNAGLGNILRAQRAAGGVSDYARIIARLPDITGPNHSAETIGYVMRILSYWTRQITGEI